MKSIIGLNTTVVVIYHTQAQYIKNYGNKGNEPLRVIETSRREINQGIVLEVQTRDEAFIDSGVYSS